MVSWVQLMVVWPKYFTQLPLQSLIHCLLNGIENYDVIDESTPIDSKNAKQKLAESNAGLPSLLFFRLIPLNPLWHDTK